MLNSEPVTLSHLSQSLLWLDGKPFSLYNYPMFEAIYDGRFPATHLMCGRQVGKSVGLAAFSVIESVAMPFFRELYVSPSKEQTIRFSTSRLGKILAYSPLIKKYFQTSDDADRVLHRSFSNGSEMYLSYADDDPDRVRGVSADRILYDEVQDILYDAVVPVVNKCLSNSNYRFETYAGTPKTTDNTIQHIWDMSTQTEWVMKCEGCSKYSFIASERAIGKTGPICVACGHALNPRLGFWMDMVKRIPDDSGYVLKGFHIPQPIMPENVAIACPQDEESQRVARRRWGDILRAVENEPPSKVRNEILGMSDALGRRLISQEELESLCTGKSVNAPITERIKGIRFCSVGIDWSGGGAEQKSRTVVWVWGYDPLKDVLRTVFYKIFPGNDQMAELEEVVKIVRAVPALSVIVGDAGVGGIGNGHLRNIFGTHVAWQVQYGMFAKPWDWNGVDRYMLDRTTAIDNYLMALKKKKAEFPPLGESRIPISDILNEFEEETQTGRKIWRHSPTQPDDCLHAQLFGWVGAKIVRQDFSFYREGSML